MGHADDQLHVMGIKNRSNPKSFNEPTKAVLQALVRICSGVQSPTSLPILTQRFVNEAYEELQSRDSSDRCFDNDRIFMDTMIVQIELKAREYQQNLADERSAKRKGPEGKGNIGGPG